MPGDDTSARTAFEREDYDTEVFRGLEAGSVLVEGVRFLGCTFEDCHLQGARFVSCVFDDCSFVDCDMALVTVVNTVFCGTTFTNSKVSGVNWSDADWSSKPVLEPFRFSTCVLDFSVFMGLTLGQVAFRDCSLRDVDFSDADLREADFAGSDLGGARFVRSDLRRARLEAAHSYEIDTNENVVRGMRVSFPEAASLLASTGVEIVGPVP